MFSFGDAQWTRNGEVYVSAGRRRKAGKYSCYISTMEKVLLPTRLYPSLDTSCCIDSSAGFVVDFQTNTIKYDEAHK
jgi:hypothetical protein